MKVVRFSVTNYRSIKKANLPLSELTVLIGPNNEGKSNILNALVVALDIASTLSSVRVYKGAVFFQNSRKAGTYQWERDIPISLQQKGNQGQSEFVLEFELNENDIKDFKTEVNSKLDGTLPIRIVIGKEDVRFFVVKKGPGGKALSNKADKIAKFIGKRIDFAYIPSIRTATESIDVIEETLGRELEAIEEEQSYKDALNEIKKLQRPLLDRLSKQVTATLKEFLPKVSSVRIEISEEARYRAMRRSISVVVDDGTPTRLQRKGDGVQSLAAISLMRHASESKASGRHLILAIEEPESHLHPKAIHQLKNVISDIVRERQVILTTHCPLLADRQALRSNIIVRDGKASPAKSVEEIREVLGVKTSDNLKSAELVLVVEGEDDRKALYSILSYESEILASSLQSGLLAIDSLTGASNLLYKLGLLRESLCKVHCFLDHDAAGKSALKAAETEGLIRPVDSTLSICNGMIESELEDTYDTDIYRDALFSKYGVDVNSSEFGGSKKWADRMRTLMLSKGKTWNESRKQEVKNDVAQWVSEADRTALQANKRSSVDALVEALEQKLRSIKA